MNTLAVSSLLYFLMSFLSLNDYLKYDNFVETPFDNEHDIKTYIYNDTFYYAQRTLIKTDSIKYFEFHCIKNNKDFAFKVVPPVINPLFLDKYELMIDDFAIRDSHLVILVYDYLYIYKINSKNEYIIENTIPIDKTKTFGKIYLGENSLILVNERYYSSMDTAIKKNVYIGKIDNFKSKEIKYEYIYQNDYSKLMMFQPRKITTYDIKNNLFFVSEILDYKIRIFQDTTLVDSISMDMSIWNDTLADKIKNKIKDYNSQGFVQAKEIISQLQEDVSNTNLIQSIQYLKDDKLLVIWEEPSKLRGINLHFDLWEKINNKWGIKCQDIKVPKYNIDNKLSQNSFLPSSMFDVFDCGKLVCSTNYSLNRFDPKYFNMTASEFKTISDKELENSELKTYFYIFKLDFDK